MPKQTYALSLKGTSSQWRRKCRRGRCQRVKGRRRLVLYEPPIFIVEAN